MMLRRNRLLSATVLSVLLCFSLVTSVRAEAAMWTQTYDRDEIWESEMDFIDKTEEGAHSLVATSDGGYALAGYTRSFGAGGSDFWLVKTDSAGNVEWNQTYGGEGIDEAASLVETSDGGYAMIGTTTSFGAGGSDFWLVKTDSAGNVEWNQTYGGEKWEFASSLVETSDGGYAMIGTTTSFGVDDSVDCWLVKTNATGDMEWHQTYGSPFYDVPRSVVETSDGGYALAGTWGKLNSYWPSEPEKDVHTAAFCLIKTDGFGNVEWNMTYGGGAIDEAYSLVETSDGGYAIAGVTTSFGANVTEDFWLVKTDENGVAPVAPEATWVILPFLLAATVSIFISKKKLLNRRSKES
jgi:predicted secreted protein